MRRQLLRHSELQGYQVTDVKIRGPPYSARCQPGPRCQVVFSEVARGSTARSWSIWGQTYTISFADSGAEAGVTLDQVALISGEPRRYAASGASTRKLGITHDFGIIRADDGAKALAGESGGPALGTGGCPRVRRCLSAPGSRPSGAATTSCGFFVCWRPTPNPSVRPAVQCKTPLVCVWTFTCPGTSMPASLARGVSGFVGRFDSRGPLRDRSIRNSAGVDQYAKPCISRRSSR